MPLRSERHVRPARTASRIPVRDPAPAAAEAGAGESRPSVRDAARGPTGAGAVASDYSYDIGAWHVIALNYLTAGPFPSPLRASAAHPNRCVLAVWHHRAWLPPHRARAPGGPTTPPPVPPPAPSPPFKTAVAYQPTGDQPQAIAQLSESLRAGAQYQSLLGATGTGKTATMAWIIEELQRPALVIAHNKTLAAQLCNEFREFFPDNAVEYFVSYYDYYQPEAYVPQADLYIEKDSSRNDDIDRLRHSATSSLLSRSDAVIVASVSAIYGLGSPEEYEKRVVMLHVGEDQDRDVILRKLVDIHYTRNDTLLGRGKFRVKGDVIEIQPAHEESAYRISMFGDEIEQITLSTR